MGGIILFTDKLGITEGYEPIWKGLLARAELDSVPLVRRNSAMLFGRKMQTLVKAGNRKAPGFNSDPGVMGFLRSWVHEELQKHEPSLCLCMDPAILFLCNPDWDQATLEKLRGGVYYVQGIPFVVMLGISAWHSNKKEKDIARLNDGYIDEEEWEEEHGGEESDSEDISHIWLEPLSVPYGRFVLQQDLHKAKRLYTKETRK